MTIDVKIEGLRKMKKIPIERIGVHSFIALGICEFRRRDLPFDEDDSQIMKLREDSFYMNEVVKEYRPVNVIVNVKTLGRKRLIYFESPVVLANNL